MSQPVDLSRITVVGHGGISGYINTEVELKKSTSQKDYVQILLGRGRDSHGENNTSYNLVAFGPVAKLVAATLSKGDLIRVTKVNLMPQKSDSMDKYNIASAFTLVIDEFEKIERNENSTNGTARQQSAPQQSAPQPQPTPDSFDDDIPF